MQVKVETKYAVPSWYAGLFQELFPEEWREFAKDITRETLVEIFASTDAELAQATNAAPPPARFFELFERHYFPISECWFDWMDMAEEGEEFGWHEIPIEPIFGPPLYDSEPHYAIPAFQVLGTLNGQITYHAECGVRDCPLRPVYLIAANELHRVNKRMLSGFCRRERSPLKYLAFALEVMGKETGNIWFDYQDEMYGQTGCEWNAGIVRALKRDYDEASKQANGVIELSNWLRDDPRRIREASALWRRCAA